MNDDAPLYSQHSSLQKQEVSEILDKYLKLISCHNGDNILDVGAGEASISLEVLLPHLPTKIKELVLLDISEKMLKSGQNKCDDERVKFVKMDICLEKIPLELIQRFDHVFSFYCLNWIVEEAKVEKAMKNIYDMLKPGGNIFFIFIASAPIYNIWENMAESEKWSVYIKNVQTFISLYHHEKNRDQKLRRFLEAAGFEVRECKHIQRRFTYPSLLKFMNFNISINPFIKLLPEDRHDEYIRDLQEEMRKQSLITFENCNGEEKIHISYTIMVAFACKSMNY